MQHAFLEYSSENEQDEINLTPMLDVVFIMLIFFIVTASFIKESGIDANRPDQGDTRADPSNSILVAIGEHDDIWIDRRSIDRRAVRPNLARLSAENPDATVVIQVDPRSTTDALVQVMDASRSVGIYTISIAE